MANQWGDEEVAVVPSPTSVVAPLNDWGDEPAPVETVETNEWGDVPEDPYGTITAARPEGLLSRAKTVVRESAPVAAILGETPNQALRRGQQQQALERDLPAVASVLAPSPVKEVNAQPDLKDARNSFARGALDQGVGGMVEGATRLADTYARAANRFAAESDEGMVRAVLPQNPEAAAAEARARAAVEIAPRPLQQAADAVGMFREAVREVYPVDVGFSRSTTGQVVSGVGQVPAYAAAMMTGLGIPAVYGQMFDAGYQDARASGADETTALTAAVANLPAGALEYASSRLMLGPALKAFKGAAPDVQRALATRVAQTARAAATEAVTEGAQQVVTNTAAQALYDRDRALTEGVGQSMVVGGLVGGLVAGVSEGVDAATERLTRPTAEESPTAPAPVVNEWGDVAIEDPQYQYTVQQPQVHPETGGVIPGYVQVDEIVDGVNTRSTNLDALAQEGIKLPPVPPTLPSGRYMAEEVAKGENAVALADPEVAAMPEVPAGTPTALHAEQRMPVALEPVVPGQVDVPTVMQSLENVVRVLGGESPIRVGYFNQQARGIFKTFSEVIRLRQADNIPTAAHEVGHAVAKQLFGSAASQALVKQVADKTVLRELRALGFKLYGQQQPAAGYSGEGFAELLRLWLTTEDAAKSAPAATAWLEKTMLAQAPLGAAMRAARDKIDIWRGQGAQGRARAQMKDPEGRLTALRKGVRKVLGKQAQIEEFSPLKELSDGFAKIAGKKLAADQDPYLLASAFRKTAGPTLQTWVERGMTDPWGNITGPGLKEALKRISPAQSEDFVHYLWARRAIERWSKGQNPGMAKEDALYLREKLERPEFVDAAQKYYQWWDGALAYLEAASPATNGPLVAAIRANSHDYVPLARDLSSVATKFGETGGTGGGLYKMSGSGLPVKNIYLQSLLVAENIIARAHRDLVLDSILSLSDHEGMGWLVEEVPKTRVMKSVNIEKIRGELEKQGVDTSGIPEDTLIQYAAHLDAPAGTAPIVMRKIGEETKWFQVPAEVYELLSGVETPARLGWAFELLLGAPTRAFKLGTTGLRASFSLVTNPARDFPTFMLQSVAGNPASRAATWFGSMSEILKAGLSGKESPELALFHQLGISAANFLGGDIRQAQREAKALFHGKWFKRVVSPVETFRDLLSFSESAPRLAELNLLAKEMGWKPGQPITPAQATLLRVAAKRVTTDFSAAGGMGREINRAIPFYNAAVQGMRSAARAFKTDQETKQVNAAALRAILNGVMLLTGPAMAAWLVNRDKEWYRQLPWRERWLYLNVERGGTVYQVPLPQEWGASFAVLPVALLDSWYMSDPEPMKEATKHLFAVLNPIDYPVLAKAAKEQWSNRIDFFDRPIIPRGELDLRPGDQRSPYSSWLAKALGDTFPEQVSPRRVDAAIREVFGGAGSDLVDAPTAFMRALGLGVEEKQRETELSDLPVFGRLARRGGTFTANNQYLIDFWDDYNRYSAWRASNSRAISEGRHPVRPMGFRDQMYAGALADARPAVQMLLEVASRTPDIDKRQALYKQAANFAKSFTKNRPHQPDGR